MTYEQFFYWLAGYLSSYPCVDEVDTNLVNSISEKMKEVIYPSGLIHSSYIPSSELPGVPV